MCNQFRHQRRRSLAKVAQLKSRVHTICLVPDDLSVCFLHGGRHHRDIKEYERVGSIAVASPLRGKDSENAAGKEKVRMPDRNWVVEGCLLREAEP
jgi:hypothetical protein